MKNMGKKDTLTKEYMADNHIFADAFNYFMFDGGNVIHAEDLRERDSTEMAITYERNQKISPVQKNRDHLIPVITVVIYFGADEWDAPRSLHEMFDEDSKAFLSLVPDYKLNIIAPANMTNDEINKSKRK